MVEQGEVFIDVAALKGTPNLPGYLAKAATLRELSGGHCSLGSYMQALSPQDLEALVELGFATGVSPDAQAEFALLIAVLLNAEGTALQLSEDTTDYIRRIFLLAQAEQLFRQGFVHLDHPNLSISTFSPDQIALTHKGRQQWTSVVVSKRG